MFLAKGWTTRRGPREVRLLWVRPSRTGKSLSPIFPYSAAAEGLDRVKGFSKDSCHRPSYRIRRGGFDLWWLPFILVLGRKFHSFSTKSQYWGPPWGFKAQGRERNGEVEGQRGEGEKLKRRKKKERYAVEEWRLRVSVARRLGCQLPLDPIEEEEEVGDRKTTQYHLCYVCLFYISEKCDLQLRPLLTWSTPVTTLHGHCLAPILEGFTHL